MNAPGYDNGLGAFDFGAAATSGYQNAIAQSMALAQQQRALQQQANLDAARQAAIANPSAKTFNALMVLDPQNHEAFKQAWDGKDKDTQKADLAEMSALRGYLAAGKPEVASQRVQRRIDADKAAGVDTKDDEDLLSLISDDPDNARNVVDYHIATILGPDKWESTYKTIGDAARADAKLPGEIEKVGAETNQLIAGTKKLGAETDKVVAETSEIPLNGKVDRSLKAAQVQDIASQIQNRADRLQLDGDILATNTNLALEKLAADREINGGKLSGPSEQEMTKAVLSAESSRALGARSADLANKIEGATLSGGWMSWLAQNGGTALGSPNLLRKEYQSIINSQAVKNLPPGPASDKDIMLARQGFPAATANAKTMASFLRGVAKMQDVAANHDQARADWISENGNLGKAKHDITVNGVKVPAGANWLDFSNSQSAIERREATVQNRAYMQKYGQ